MICYFAERIASTPYFLHDTVTIAELAYHVIPASALHFVHLLFRELLCSEIFHRFHDNRVKFFKDSVLVFCFSTDRPDLPFPVHHPAKPKNNFTFAVPFCVLVKLLSGRTRFCFLVGRLFIDPVGKTETNRYRIRDPVTAILSNPRYRISPATSCCRSVRQEFP